jgi:hypothetical protein
MYAVLKDSLIGIVHFLSKFMYDISLMSLAAWHGVALFKTAFA